jgi:prepilin-type processing-associated H-X9-DG protein
MSQITAIASANPSNRFPQPVIAEFMLKTMHFHNGESRKLKTIFKASGISYRHSVLEDYGKTDDFAFYPRISENSFPSTRDRLQIFREHALPLSITAVTKLFAKARHISPSAITHLIVVCCTGMYAPGLDIELISALNLKTTVHRTAINFMGCYAAFNALKIADSFCKSEPDAKVLVVCTELCSLHFQPEATDDNLLANALFADGSAAVLVEAESTSKLRLELTGFHNDLATDGSKDMAWTIGDLGFEMRLSAYVPDIIRNGIATLTRTLLEKIQGQFSDIKHFAIHPGGKKILEVIEQELMITKDQNKAAYHVLQNYGNMSSATILFVLEELIRNLGGSEINEHILSFAFGPGLTMESMILQIKSIPHA